MGDFTHAASNEPVRVCVCGGRGARWHCEFQQNVADVAVDGPFAEHELGGDGLIRVSRGDQPEHLQLAAGEATGAASRTRVDQCGQPGRIRCCTKPPESVTGGGEFPCGRVIVAEFAAGETDQCPARATS